MTGHGPFLGPTGTTFRLWAPAAKTVELVVDRPLPMRSEKPGWHALTLPGPGAGTRYKFRIDGEVEVPDPASGFQPEDVGGPSEVIDHGAYEWRSPEWRGRPWEDAAILELHVGTFTPERSFRAAIDKLDHVAQAGFTAIELMPVADFAGSRNWGYDGVLLYAPDSAYGRPDDLRALVDAAHQRGLMVLLDVVYNHFGPEGNYLGRYAPQFFTSGATPWGQAIDYRVPEVRAFAIDNALHWLQHYRFDGLRLDAVHAILERGEPSMLDELSRAAGALAGATGRAIHLVLENDDNHARLLDPRTDPPRGRYRAQWNDDYHHAWHVLLTGETHGYYGDYTQPLDRIVQALSSGFAYQGEPSAHRDGKPRGEPSAELPPTAFVDFLQNHDQIGNRALGDRLESQVGVPAMEAALAVMLLAPQPPLMFMGEEWGSVRPFPFFCDFKGALAEAVRKGRRAEFKSAYQKFGDEIPDPLDDRTFRSATLDWEENRSEAGRRRLALVRELLTLRRDRVVPLLAGIGFDAGNRRGSVITAAWRTTDGRRLRLLANLSDSTSERPAEWSGGAPLWGGEPAATLPPWSVFWSVTAPDRRAP
ncbi:MAG TPA: malto-oligosyltrehalose trehalohydrolase [Xanthobacteraceae bacterium]|jgi:malto-oligosyltrehalose trehalohydrolase|nr:malto-oligosyltrehalose trehalohydrolase [Xanthobacteraceae bacterium]